MQTVYRCEICKAVFESEQDRYEHQKKCPHDHEWKDSLRVVTYDDEKIVVITRQCDICSLRVDQRVPLSVLSRLFICQGNPQFSQEQK